MIGIARRLRMGCAAGLAALVVAASACAAPDGRAGDSPETPRRAGGAAGDTPATAAGDAPSAAAAGDTRATAAGDTPSAAAAGDARVSAATAGPGKPTAPISIGHEWLEPPALGRSLRLRISVASSRELGDVTISLVGGEGLVVDGVSASTRVPAIEAGAAHTFEPLALAAVPGTHYLGVSVTATVDGREQTRSVTIPVRLGEPASSQEANAATDATNAAVASERVRSLPAEERVDRR